MEEVTPHVYSLDVKIDWFPQPFPPNVHLIKDGGEGALIDAGFPDDESINTRMEWLRSVPPVVPAGIDGLRVVASRESRRLRSRHEA